MISQRKSVLREGPHPADPDDHRLARIPIHELERRWKLVREYMKERAADGETWEL